jgi:hypothetical protein
MTTALSCYKFLCRRLMMKVGRRRRRKRMRVRGRRRKREFT